MFKFRKSHSLERPDSVSNEAGDGAKDSGTGAGAGAGSSKSSMLQPHTPERPIVRQSTFLGELASSFSPKQTISAQDEHTLSLINRLCAGQEWRELTALEDKVSFSFHIAAH